MFASLKIRVSPNLNTIWRTTQIALLTVRDKLLMIIRFINIFPYNFAVNLKKKS